MELPKALPSFTANLLFPLLQPTLRSHAGRCAVLGLRFGDYRLADYACGWAACPDTSQGMAGAV